MGPKQTHHLEVVTPVCPGVSLHTLDESLLDVIKLAGVELYGAAAVQRGIEDVVLVEMLHIIGIVALPDRFLCNPANKLHGACQMTMYEVVRDSDLYQCLLGPVNGDQLESLLIRLI